MKMIIFAVLQLFLTTAVVHAQQKAVTQDGRTVLLYSSGTWVYADQKVNKEPYSFKHLEIPKVGNRDLVVHHTGFTLSYNEKHEQASWVAYVLTKEETLSGQERTDRFLEDTLVSSGTADDLDYKGTGYDRGHLAPAADMGWSATSMRESFYYSNMSPQLPGFNRGVWKRLEELVRFWAVNYDSVYIITGPVLEDDLPAIGHNHVSIPRYYYKAILRHRMEGWEGIGFVLPHASSSHSLKNFAVSLDSVESITGLDLFIQLPDEMEERIENTVNMKAWQWSRTKVPEYDHKTSTRREHKVRY
jgi:endonuclease G